MPLHLVSPLSQAAEAIAAFSLDSPSKLQECLLDDRKRSVSPDTLGEESDQEQNDIAALRTKFVGEVDLPECKFSSLYHCPYLVLCAGEEPLLKESKRRFVLFPIQYHEVRVPEIPWTLQASLHVARYGKCTRKPKHPSGLLRRWTSPRIFMTGTLA